MAIVGGGNWPVECCPGGNCMAESCSGWELSNYQVYYIACYIRGN